MKYESKFARWIRAGGQSEFLLPWSHGPDLEKKFALESDRLLDSILDNAMVMAVRDLNQFLPENTSINISSVDVSDIKTEFAETVSRRLSVTGVPVDPDDPVISSAIRHYAAQLNARFQSVGLGATDYIWRSRDDATVRATHQVYDDQQFAWVAPPSGGHPGEAFGCRCLPEPVLDGVVFPEGSTCDILNADMLSEVFPEASEERLNEIAKEVDLQIVTGKLDSANRLEHFFGQVRQEAGASINLEENLNYGADRLPRIFPYFRRNPEEAELFGRSEGHAADEAAIANRAYANQIGNGDVESGDGWRYRGRGLKQLTGRANYRDFTRWHRETFGSSEDFEANPDLLLESEFAVRSAVYFWVEHDLNLIADRGFSQSVADDITRIVNQNTNSYGQRWEHVRRFHDSGIFSGVCTFSTAKPRFEDQ